MKMASRGTIVYVVLIGFLLVWAYVVQNDTRRVDGTSMLPTLEGGDLVIIQSVPIADVHLNDVIVYNGLCSVGGESVVHRVVAVTTGGLITKGDNNPGSDQALNIASGPITQQCLEGKVVFVVPYLELLAYYVDAYHLPWWFNYFPSMLIVLIILASFLLQDEGEDAEGEKQGAEPAPAQ
ncbi:MAG: signal peptidase I [Thaumarchaeota archaeon]|nr:signal peptidase I [Nitrososphaerota archaeon]